MKTAIGAVISVFSHLRQGDFQTLQRGDPVKDTPKGSKARHPDRAEAKLVQPLEALPRQHIRDHRPRVPRRGEYRGRAQAALERELLHERPQRGVGADKAPEGLHPVGVAERDAAEDDGARVVGEGAIDECALEEGAVVAKVVVAVDDLAYQLDWEYG